MADRKRVICSCLKKGHFPQEIHHFENRIIYECAYLNTVTFPVKA